MKGESLRGRPSAGEHDAGGRSLVATFLLVSLVVLSSLSCAVRRPAPEEFVPQDCPSRTLKLLKSNTDCYRTIRGTLRTRLTLERAGYSGTLQAGLAAQKPDRARLKIYAGFSTVLDVTVEGDSLRAFIPPKSTLLLGSVRDQVVAFEAGTFLAILRDALFPAEFCSGACLFETAPGGTCRLEDELPGGKRISFVETKSGRLRGMQWVNSEGDEWARVSYRDYKRSGEVSFPRDIAISFPSAQFETRLLFDRVQLNKPLDSGSFELEVPPGTVVKTLSELVGSEREEFER
ncbi:MAG: DUF4292 domain-containing protein [Candidatus Eiseniibacteriota bacterium]|nr:MAG: DUF4292 domain-containing protein [Candidatus Eisenbacteria bacterium]